MGKILNTLITFPYFNELLMIYLGSRKFITPIKLKNTNIEKSMKHLKLLSFLNGNYGFSSNLGTRFKFKVKI